jgi:hypothetical protein
MYKFLHPSSQTCNSSIDPNTHFWGDPISLEESLSITTGRRDLAIATHARKMHKKISI